MNLRWTAVITCTAAALLVAPLTVGAAVTTNTVPRYGSLTLSASPSPSPTPKPSSSMNRSESQIAKLLAETNADKQSKLFSSLVKPRLLYATMRSLCGREDGWLAFVDIYRQYGDERENDYTMQQATVQYGLQQLPQNIGSVVLTIGSADYTLERNRLSFRFPDDLALDQDPLTGNVEVTVTQSGKAIRIGLNQDFPGMAPSIDKALATMTPAYVTFAQDQDPLPIDHAFIRLRSYVRNMTTLERAYVWELYLVHSVDLPAQTTIIRWDVLSNATSVSLRTLNEYC